MSRQADFEREYRERQERESRREQELLDGIEYHLNKAIELSIERWSSEGEYAYDYIQHLLRSARPSSHIYRPSPLVVRIATRDGWMCHYCHAPFYTPGQKIEGDANFASIDHKIPRSRGGTDQNNNLVVACSDCNSTKGARHTYEEFYAMTAPLRGGRQQG